MRFALLIFLPETPHYWIQKNNFEGALKSLKFYRTCTSDGMKIEAVEKEFESLKDAVLHVKKEEIKLSDFCKENLIIVHCQLIQMVMHRTRIQIFEIYSKK